MRRCRSIPTSGHVLDDLQSQIVAAWSQSSAEFKERVRQILDRGLDEIGTETSHVPDVGHDRPTTFSRKAVMTIVAAASLSLVAVAVILALVLPSSNGVPLGAPTIFPSPISGVSQRPVAEAPYVPVTPPTSTLPIPGPQPSDVPTAIAEVETAFTTVYGHEPDGQKAGPAPRRSGSAGCRFWGRGREGVPADLGGLDARGPRGRLTDPTNAAVLYGSSTADSPRSGRRSVMRSSTTGPGRSHGRLTARTLTMPGPASVVECGAAVPPRT